MYNTQANTARFIYTISASKPSMKNKNNEHLPVCHLKNGFYFTKESRSDEKVRYTETDIECVVRTVMFMHVFEVSTENSLIEIITTGQCTYDFEHADLMPKNELNARVVVELLDTLFGDNFATIVRRVISKCMQEYNMLWRNYPYTTNVKVPCALDYLKLARFVNMSLSCYAEPTLYILDNNIEPRLKHKEIKCL